MGIRLFLQVLQHFNHAVGGEPGCVSPLIDRELAMFIMVTAVIHVVVGVLTVFGVSMRVWAQDKDRRWCASGKPRSYLWPETFYIELY